MVTRYPEKSVWRWSILTLVSLADLPRNCYLNMQSMLQAAGDLSPPVYDRLSSGDCTWAGELGIRHLMRTSQEPSPRTRFTDPSYYPEAVSILH